MRLPRGERIKGRTTMLRMIREGASVEGSLLVIRYQINADCVARRAGFTVSRRFRRAVDRNLVRRRLREVYRTHREQLPDRGDFLIIARAGAEHATYAEIVESFTSLAGRIADPDPEPADTAL
ncbi:ribonuclease P protein component [Gemmatimonadota bacterium]